MAATIDVEDAYRRLLQEQGFDPIRQVFYRVIVSRYLVSGARSKRQFMTRLVDEEADIIWVLAADVAIDIYTLHVQGEAAEPAADLIARAVTSAKGAAVPLPSPELVEFVTGSNDLKSFLDSGRQSTADIVG
ncbi:MAG: hypothetical protein KDB53_16300, partial [Planctomycetes bacterium]|nr:hypothetical protein [Planctomycetota bacterium]